MSEPQLGSTRILLVEDNPDDELLTRRALAQYGLAVHMRVARDGVEAIDYLLGSRRPDGSTDELPRVVWLDWKLPRMAGIDVLRRLRGASRTRLLPIVVLTSSLEDRDIFDAYQNGANSYIRKPIDSTQFSTMVALLGRYWLGANEAVHGRAPG